MLKVAMIGGALLLLLPFINKLYLLYRVYWSIIMHKVPPFIFFSDKSPKIRIPIGFGGADPTPTTARKKNV